MAKLTEIGDSDDNLSNDSSKKRQRCSKAPPSGSSGCVREQKYKGCNMHCKSSMDEAKLTENGGSEDNLSNSSSKKRHRCSGVPPSSSGGVKEHKYKGCSTHCKSSMDEAKLTENGDSDDNLSNSSPTKRQRCSGVPPSSSSGCVKEQKYKGCKMQCKISMDEASTSNSTWTSIKSQFIEMGYSTTIVEQALEECGLENENALLEHILNNQESPSDSSWCLFKRLRTHFVSMGYSPMLVEKAIEECGPESETAILEFISNNQDIPCGSSLSSISAQFVCMGYSPSIVDKAVEECGKYGEGAIFESILTYEALHKISNDENSLSMSESSDNEDTFEDVDDTAAFDGQVFEAGKDTECSQESDITRHLMEMGFQAEDVASAIERFGIDIPVHIMIESIRDVQHSRIESNENFEVPNKKLLKNKGLLKVVQKDKSMNFLESKELEAANGENTESVMLSGKNILQSLAFPIKKMPFKKQCVTEKVLSKHMSLNNGHGKMILHSSHNHKRMFGFGVPGHPLGQCQRQLNEFAQGPPYFYFENVAIAPQGVWKTVSRFLYDIDPEFVDSKYFSVSSRKRGYVHNLPIENRYQISPLPPMTIQEAFPDMQKYWPSWDYRTKLNCINTAVGSAPLCDRMRSIIKCSDGNPSIQDQARILHYCKKWNLVWVGPDQLAPLEPHEMEIALGFEVGHTRGASTRTERVRSLGNAFQVDTVGYHLSVLKCLYPNGVNVLSLFSGIGGAEVALDRLGITLKYVVSAEICKENRLILKSWWEKTQQKGKLIELEDVQNLAEDELEDLIDMVGGFDLIIGGSPCNNLTGSNRRTRDGLDGKHSSLFFEFSRIVNTVRYLIRSKGNAKKSEVL